MNDLSIRVSATDMASSVLAAVGDNVKSLGHAASNAFDMMQTNAIHAGQQITNVTNSSMIFVGGAGSLSLVSRALTSIAGAGVVAASAVAGVGAAAVLAASKATRDLDKVSTTLKLIEAQRLNISIGSVSEQTLGSFANKIKDVSNALLNCFLPTSITSVLTSRKHQKRRFFVLVMKSSTRLITTSLHQLKARLTQSSHCIKQ